MTLMLRLRRPVDCRRDRFKSRVRRLAHRHRADPRALWGRFAFRCDERDFAETLLSRHTHYWLYRTDQAGACGDFVAIDMSSPKPSRRSIVALELKLGGTLRTSGGVQLRNIDSAVSRLHALGVAGTSVRTLCGCRHRVLREL